MKHLFVNVALIILCCSFFSCDPGASTSVENDGSSFIDPTYFVDFTGTITDAYNQPVENVAVQYEFSYDSIRNAKSSNAQPTTTISYAIPVEGKVSVKVLRYGTRELISVLVDTTQRAGMYSVIFNAKNSGNGIYIYQLTVNNKITEKLMIISGMSANDIINANPIATTRYDGKFKVPTSVFGVGLQFGIVNETGRELNSYLKISNKIRLIFIKSGKIIGIQSVTIDTTQNQNMNFVVSN